MYLKDKPSLIIISSTNMELEEINVKVTIVDLVWTLLEEEENKR